MCEWWHLYYQEITIVCPFILSSLIGLPRKVEDAFSNKESANCSSSFIDCFDMKNDILQTLSLCT